MAKKKTSEAPMTEEKPAEQVETSVQPAAAPEKVHPKFHKFKGEK